MNDSDVLAQLKTIDDSLSQKLKRSKKVKQTGVIPEEFKGILASRLRT
jgi:hypothetical protein